MGTINVTDITDGTTADADDVNSRLDIIVDEFNGNIDNANIKSSAAIDGSKIADDSITGAKVDWSQTGADGMWWEELGRTTLGSAGNTITVDSLAERKYLKILVWAEDNGATITAELQFNNDTGNNYSFRNSINGGADTTATSSDTININASSGGVYSSFAELYVRNIADEEKVVLGHVGTAGSNAGAANLPTRKETCGKWANTSDSITRVDVIDVSANGFAIGSEVIVLGHD